MGVNTTRVNSTDTQFFIVIYFSILLENKSLGNTYYFRFKRDFQNPFVNV